MEQMPKIISSEQTVKEAIEHYRKWQMLRQVCPSRNCSKCLLGRVGYERDRFKEKLKKLLAD